MTRRRARTSEQPQLFAVPNAPAQAPGPADDAKLAFIREQLAAAGVPPEALETLESPEDAERLVEGLLTDIDAAAEASVDELLAGWAALLAPDADALDAELAGLEMVGALSQANELAGGGDDELAMILAGLAEGAATSDNREARAMLESLAVVGPPPIARSMRAGAERMAAAGVEGFRWTGPLGSLSVGEAFSYGNKTLGQQVVAVDCDYPGVPHTVNVLIDHDLGGGVKDCYFSDDPEATRRDYQRLGRQVGVKVRDMSRDDAHATLARALAAAPCPAEPDQIDDVAAYLPAVRRRVELLRAAPAEPRGAAKSKTRQSKTRPSNARQSTAGPAKARQSTATQPTAVHRLKVSLKGAKPPIWRRIEVPSAIALDELHACIQAVFGWQGGHLWMFSTPFEEYGVAGFDLGLADPASAALSDVAPAARDRIRYTYDFGDDWDHDILVEAVGPGDATARYPRCTGGRRACPPDDCGGVWGYEDLLRVLADPDDPEHHDTMEWLGLDSPDDLDPAAFDVSAANERLTLRVPGR